MNTLPSQTHRHRLRARCAGALVAIALIVVVVPVASAADTGSLYWGTTAGVNSIVRSPIVTPTVANVFAATSAAPSGVYLSSGAAYWTSSAGSTIGTANLAGQGVNPNFIPGAVNPTGVVSNGQYIYWSDNGFIGRTNLNGSAAQTGIQWFATPGVQNLAIWVDQSYAYWASATAIGRVSLAGTGATPAFVANSAAIPNAVASPGAIVTDATNIYWTNAGGTNIGRMNLAGNPVISPVFINTGTRTAGLAETGNAFYWTNPDLGTIGSANLSGTVTNGALVTGLLNPISVAATRYALTVARAGAGAGGVTSSVGGISCGATCAMDFPDMATVTLTAAATTGSLFGGWTGACTGAALTCTVTMSQAQTTTATFNLVPINYALTVVLKGTGPGSIVSTPSGINCGTACVVPFQAGTTVVLTAIEGRLSNFVGWTGTCSGARSTCTVKVDKARAVTATFNSAVVLKLSSFGLSRSKFRVGAHTTAVRTRPPVGTTIRYTLSEAANVTVVFQKRGTSKRYYLYRTSGLKGGLVGKNAISFTGRVGRMALKPGTWKVTITASEDTTTTKAQAKQFTVAPPS